MPTHTPVAPATNPAQTPAVTVIQHPLCLNAFTDAQTFAQATQQGNGQRHFTCVRAKHITTITPVKIRYPKDDPTKADVFFNVITSKDRCYSVSFNRVSKEHASLVQALLAESQVSLMHSLAHNLAPFILIGRGQCRVAALNLAGETS